MDPPEDRGIERVASNVRIVYPVNGGPPYTLEFLLDDRWMPGVTYENIEDARRAGLKLASESDLPN